MFGDLNRVELIGNLTADPELRHTGNGTPVTGFGIATNRRYQQDNEWKEAADFTNIVIWADRAERFVERAKKGTRIYVEGRLSTRSWDDADGKKQYKTEVIASRVILLDRYERGSFNNDQNPTAAQAPKTESVQKPESKKAVKKEETNDEDTIDPNDLPF